MRLPPNNPLPSVREHDLNERGFNPDVVEAALAHQDEDDVRRAYNRTTYFKERLILMQDWADLLDRMRPQQVASRAAG